MSDRRLRIATRSSPLALWQAERVAERLGGGCELVPVESLGDRVQDRPLHEIGGQGVFVKEVQAAVLRGDADLAVHSAKDLPSAPPPPGLVLACVPERDDPRDCLVGAALADLGEGATVATGSVRRRAQLAALRPDLRFVELRGNMATRLSRVPEGGAVVAAHAALRRLGLAHLAAEVLDPDVLVPQVAQGALAVECRGADRGTLERLAAVEDAVARRCVDAERAFLAQLGGGCDLPVGALAEPDEGGGRPGRPAGGGAPGPLRIRALVAGRDGAVHTADRRGGDGVALGRAVAADLAARAGL